MRIARLARAHSVLGWLGLLAFLGSGAYLRAGRPELYGGSEVVRALFRANHLYLLAAATLNLLASRVSGVEGRVRGALRALGSYTLLVTPFVLGAAFLREPPQGLGGRPLTTVGLVLTLVGTLLLTLTTPKARNER